MTDRPPMARPRDAFPSRALLLALFALLLVARAPEILIKSRFWAEEGSRFLVFAWSLPWWRALLVPWGGYLNLVANLGAVLAWHALPLEFAPYATSGLALAIQLCPAILLLTSDLPWLARPRGAVAALLLVLLVPDSQEVWISSIGSQVHLALCAGIILGLEARGGAVGAFRLFLLVLGGLSGPGPWSVLPLFAARAALDRSAPRALQAAALGGTVLVQFAFFYSHDPLRAYAIRPVAFLDLAFGKHVVLPFLGPGITRRMARGIQAGTRAGYPPVWPAALMAAILLLLAAAIRRRREPAAFWLLAGAAFTTAVTYVGVLDDFTLMFPPGSGQRYDYAPQVLIGLAALAVARGGRRLAGPVATVATCWLLAVGAVLYFKTPSRHFVNGPGWRVELARHRRDPSYLIRSWPPGWSVPLPDDRAPAR